jgi:cell division septation protein DedD
VSVTIILAAIVGVGIWLYYPRADAEPDALAEADGGLEWEPLDYLRGDGPVPGLDESEADLEEEDDFVVTYGVVEEEEDQADAGFVREEPAPVHPGAVDRDREGEPRADRAPAGVDETEPVPGDAAAAGRDAERDAEPQERPRAAEPAPEPAAVARARESEERAPAREPAPAARTAEPELADRAYWVQAISSPNRDTVERAQRTLREHQLGTRILTKEIGGTTYFRLRLGPFAVREEAEKFLGWVTQVDGFGDAMIFVDYTTAVLAARPE